MNGISIGDLAHDFMLRRQNVELKQTLSRLTVEMATGRPSDTARHLQGRFDHLAGFARDLAKLEHHRVTAEEVRSSAGAMQRALEQVQGQSVTLGERLIVASTAATQLDVQVVAQTAKGNLDAIVSALNTTAAGRALFSGTLVSARPLADAETLLAGLRGAIAGLTNATDVLAATDAFFDTPGGTFEATIYQGGTEDLAPRSLGSGEAVTLSVRADDPALRTALKTAALSALIDDPGLALLPGETRNLLRSLSELALGAQAEVIAIRSDLGYAEERIETASVRINAEIASISLARNELLSVDLFETATDLEAVQTQIETLYTVTARSSRLSLVNFLS